MLSNPGADRVVAGRVALITGASEAIGSRRDYARGAIKSDHFENLMLFNSAGSSLFRRVSGLLSTSWAKSTTVPGKLNLTRHQEAAFYKTISGEKVGRTGTRHPRH
jgi:hypothetical protein